MTLSSTLDSSPKKQPLQKGGGDKDAPTKKTHSSKQLILATLFGIVFGFLLQKGGVAKYHILIGVLLFEDFTVVKIMLTAIVVGCIGVFTLHTLGLAKLHVKSTSYGANIIGGLVFGVGFGLLGYCPGTGAAAVGQGNWDALAGVVGLMLGSYVYAEMSESLDKTVMTWGDRGKLMLHEVVRMPLPTFMAFFIPALLAVLYALEQYSLR